jgi:hypothetical protein
VSEPTGLRLHEELLLLSLDDEKGSVRAAGFKFAVAGGLLAELLLGGRIALQRGAKPSKDRIVPADPKPFSDPLLDECLDRVRGAKKPRSPRDWVSKFSGIAGLRKRVATGLVRRGILRERRARVLLVFPWSFYPALDPSTRRSLTERLRGAVAGDGPVDEHTANLVAIAAATGVLKTALGKRLTKERKARIEAIGDETVAGAAAKAAADAARAAAAAAATSGS